MARRGHALLAIFVRPVLGAGVVQIVGLLLVSDDGTAEAVEVLLLPCWNRRVVDVSVGGEWWRGHVVDGSSTLCSGHSLDALRRWWNGDWFQHRDD